MKKLISRLMVALMTGALTFAASADAEEYDNHAAYGTVTYNGTQLPVDGRGWLRDAIIVMEEMDGSNYKYEGAVVKATSDGVVRHEDSATYAHFYCNATYDVRDRTVIGCKWGNRNSWCPAIYVRNLTGRPTSRVLVLANEETRLGEFEHVPESGAQIVCEQPVEIIVKHPDSGDVDWDRYLPDYAVDWYYADTNYPAHATLFQNDGMYYYSDVKPVSLKGDAYDQEGKLFNTYDYTVPHTTAVVMDNGRPTPEWKGNDYYGATNKYYGTTGKFQIAYRAHPTEVSFTTEPDYYFPDGTTNKTVGVDTTELGYYIDRTTFPEFLYCYAPTNNLDAPVPLIPVDATALNVSNTTWTINGVLVKKEGDTYMVLSNGTYTVTYKTAPGYCFEGAKTEKTVDLVTTNCAKAYVPSEKKPDDLVEAPTVITIDADAEADGTNTFNTLDAAFQAPLTQCATNLVLKGGIVTLSADVPAYPATNNLQVITGSGYLLINEGHADAEALAEALGALVAEDADIKVLTATATAGGADQKLAKDLAATESITLTGKTTIAGDVALIAPTTTISGTLAWDVSGDVALLRDFDDLTTVDATYAIKIGDVTPSTGVTNRTLATMATKLDGQKFTFTVGEGSYAELTVGSESNVVYNSMVYTLAMTNETDLVLTMDGDFVPEQLAAVDTMIAAARDDLYAIGLSEEEVSYSTNTLATIRSTAVAAIGVAKNKAEIDEALVAAAASIDAALETAQKLANAPVRIAGKPYETVAEAVAAAKAGDTVTIRKDVETDTTISIDKDLTLDLGTNVLSAAEGTLALDVTNATVWVKGQPDAAVETAHAAQPGAVNCKDNTSVQAPEDYDWVAVPGEDYYTLAQRTEPFTGIVTINENITNDASWAMTLASNAVVTVDMLAGTTTLASITNNLVAIEGTGTIILNGNDDAAKAYKETLEGLCNGDGVRISCVTVVPQGDGQGNVTAVVDADATKDGVASMLGIETNGTITVVVEKSATDDTVVAGELKSTAWDVVLVNDSDTTLTVPAVKAEANVLITNVTEKSKIVTLDNVIAGQEVKIENNGHLDAKIVATKDITILNTSANTIVGTYKAGGDIKVTGAYGSLSNVTLEAVGTLTLSGTNIVSGPVTLDALGSTIVKNSTLLFSIAGGNTTLCLYSDVSIWSSRSMVTGVIIDDATPSGTYLLASNATYAASRTFGLYKDGVKLRDLPAVNTNNLAIVEGVACGLTLTNSELKAVVKTVADYATTISNAAASACAEILAMPRLTGAEKTIATNAVMTFCDNYVAEVLVATDTDTAETAVADAVKDIATEQQFAKDLGDNKPYSITIDATAVADGTNVFNTLDAAFKSVDTQFATNLVIKGNVGLSAGVPAAPATNNLVTIEGAGIIIVDEARDDASDLGEALAALIVDPTTLTVTTAPATKTLTDETPEGEVVAAKSITLAGTTTIGTNVVFTAPKVVNNGTLRWDLAGDNQLAQVQGFDCITNGTGVRYEIALDADQADTTGGTITNYVIATGAASATNLAVTLTGPDPFGSKTLKVGEENTLYLDAKAYSLVVDENNSLVFTIGWGKFAIASTAVGGGIVAITNEAVAGSAVPVIAYSALDWQLESWTGTNVTGEALVFADPSAARTTLTMSVGDAFVTATFVVSDLYRAEALEAVSNDCAAAIAAISGYNLSDEEKTNYVAAVNASNEVAIATIGAAKTPQAVLDARLAAQAAFASIRDAAKELAARTWTIEAVVVDEDAGTVAVTNRSEARMSVAVVATTNALWQFEGWSGTYELDGVTTNLVFADATAPETTFEMPETNVTVTATFAVDGTYRAESLAAVSNGCDAAIAEISGYNLSDDEKAAAIAELNAAKTLAETAIGAATRPDVIATARTGADEAFAAICAAAKELAARTWTIAAVAVESDAGTVAVTNRSEARVDVPVAATPASNWQFAGWTGTDATGRALVFADATAPETTFEMPETNVTVTATFAVDGTYRAAALAAVSNDCAAAAQAINGYNLTHAEKATAIAKANAAAEAAIAEIGAATRPEAVAEARETAAKSIADIRDAARDLAARTWIIEAVAVESDAGTVAVTNRSEAHMSVAVAAMPASNWQFVGWTGADAAGKALVFADPAAPETSFTMPETNVTVTATFALDESYRAESLAAVSNGCDAAIAEVSGYNLSDDEKAAAIAELEAAKTLAETAIGAATRPDVIATARTGADEAFAAICAAAKELAARTWTIAAVAVESDAGTVSVTNRSEARLSVPVAAMPNANWQFTGWTGTDATGGALVFADATAPETTFTMPETNVTVTATFALDESYRAAETVAVSNACAAAIASVGGNASLTETERAAFTAALEATRTTALDALAKATRPAEVAAASAAAGKSLKEIADAVEEAVEAKVRFGFEEQEMTVTEGGTLDVVVYGGSDANSSAATLALVRNTYTKTPTVYFEGKKARFPLTLNWEKGDREPKVVTLAFAATRTVETDRFLTLQLQAPAAAKLGAGCVATVTVVDQTGSSPDEVPYVRALAWPANDGTVTGSGYIRTAKATRTLQARAKKWATFSGWYRAATNDVNRIDLENGFVTSEAKLKLAQDDAGTYFAYFTDGTPVIAVRDPDWTDEFVSGVATNEEGDAVCVTGVRVTFPLDFTTAEDDATGRLTVTKLPTGLSYNRRTGLVTGVPTRAGEYTVKVVGRNVSGTQTITFTMTVEEMPAAMTGTFSGELLDAAGESAGTVTLKVTKAGAVTASVTCQGKSYSFTAKGLLADGESDIAIEKANVGVFTANAAADAQGEPTGEWTGTVAGVKFGDTTYTFRLAK